MTESAQNYGNHARFVPAYHFFVFPVLILNFAMTVRDLSVAPSFGAGTRLLTAAALIVLALYARVFALTAQDRVIRLEMQLRMREVLPAALQTRIGEFSRSQLVALRFAGDAELPEIAAQVLNGRIEDKKAIKQMITSWRADHLRV